MAIIEDYISEGGAHIMVDDSALDNSPENRKKIYDNLSRICTKIYLNKAMREHEREENI